MTETLWWIIGSGLAMSAIALVGSVVLVLKDETLNRLLLPLVAFAAGSLLGGAFFHLLPSALTRFSRVDAVFLWLLGGFVVFFALEQFLHWRHCHRKVAGAKAPAGYLILLADGLHNLLGGLAIGAAFVVDIRLGLTTWLAAAAHEVPQELGDFAVLLKSGWKKSAALLFNVASGLTFLLGQLIAYFLSAEMTTDFLLPFAAGNFLYIGAADLIPEVNKSPHFAESAAVFSAFLAGGLLLYFISGHS
jgi:zinc and cadmium transporter